MKTIFARIALLGLFLTAQLASAGEERPYAFGVVSQRSPILTAEYWNPILRYVSRKSGVPLQLKLGKTGTETSEMIRRGEFDFVYSNHNFTPENDKVGYRVIARPTEAAIKGELVVIENSPVASISRLEGQEVVFPHRQAFVGYYVTMDALLRAGVRVKPLFAGNQEGAMGQLKAGRVVAASVNSQLMRDYAEREGVRYRVLWASEEFLNIPISVHPRVPRDQARAVENILVNMAADPEGARILESSAARVKQKPPYGFVRAGDRDYDNVRRFYRNSMIREEE